MRWVYKIWSGYDGFRPNQISARMNGTGRLDLGWRQYLDDAELGDDVWVWFFGPGAFDAGVYVKGIIESVDRSAHRIVLHAQDWSATTSLTTVSENLSLGPVVKPRLRQVFVLPENFRRIDNCTANLPGAPSCDLRQCDYCPLWEKLPTIRKAHVYEPPLVSGRVEAFVPAYWVIGRRSFVWRRSARIRPGVRQSSEMFYRFKTGEAALAYPLAKGMAQALTSRQLLDFDVIVPVPLSPDKLALGEIHRTLLLAKSLSALTGKPVWEAIKLSAPKGKRSSLAAGDLPWQFRRDYARLLQIDVGKLAAADTILLLDDVCTEGNTFSATVGAMHAAGVTSKIVVASAGQMTIRRAVRVDGAVLKPLPKTTS